MAGSRSCFSRRSSWGGSTTKRSLMRVLRPGRRHRTPTSGAGPRPRRARCPAAARSARAGGRDRATHRRRAARPGGRRAGLRSTGRGPGRADPHHPATGFAAAEGLEERVEATAAGVAGEQVVAADPVQQRQRLAAQRRQHMPVVHHPPTSAFRTRVAPGQRHEVLRARVQHQAVVVQPAPAAGAPPAARAPCRTPSGACSRPPGSPAPGSPRSRRCAASPAAPAPPAPRRCAPGCARVAAARHLCHERPVRIQRLEVPRPPE